MPIPLAPIAGFALRYGAVALVGAAVASRALPRKGEKDAINETAFNEVEEGLNAHRVDNEDEIHIEATHGKWKRIWLGRRGVEFDSRILARLRFRRLER